MLDEVRPDNTLIFVNLELEGFGLYRSRTEFNFFSGINVLAAPNEKGKSTMVCGIIAVFFGLSQRKGGTNPFSVERFRNWDNPQNFWGSLQFKFKGTLYRLYREFDSHRVELWIMDDINNNRQLLLEGIHNPDGRKSFEKFEDKLIEFLGMNSADVFGDTYLLSQPLPEKDNISNELQGLLSGGRGTVFHKALNRLVDDLKGLTKYTGPNGRGITARNFGKDGRLEVIDKEIEELRTKITQKKNSADSLEEIRKEIAKTEAELKQARGDLRVKEKTLYGLSKWSVFAADYRAASSESRKLSTAQKEAERLKNEIDSTDKIINSDYPEFNNMPPDIDERLAKLKNLEDSKSEESELVKRLEEDLENNLKDYEEKTKALKEFPLFEVLSGDPVVKLNLLKNQVESCVRVWRSFDELKEEVDKIEREIDEEYTLFDNMSDYEENLLHDYCRNYSLLKKKYDDALEKLNESEAKKNEYETSLIRLREQHNDLDNMPDETPLFVSRKLKALQEKKELEEERESLKPDKKKLLAIKFLFTILITFAGSSLLYLLTTPGSYLFLFAVALSVISYMISGYILRAAGKREKPDISAIDKVIKEKDDEINFCNSKLRDFAAANEAELGKLYQRFIYYKKEKEKILNEINNISNDHIEELKEKVKESGDLLKDIDKTVKPFIEKYSDVGASLNSWYNLTENKVKTKERLKQFCLEHFKTNNLQEILEMGLSDERLDNRWEDAALLITALTGKKLPLNLKSLMDIVMSIGQEEWDNASKDASFLRETLKETELVKNSNDNISGQLNEARSKLKALDEKISFYSEGIENIISVNKSIEKVIERYSEIMELLQEKKSKEIQLEAILSSHYADDINSLIQKKSFAYDKSLAIMKRWQDHIAENPGLPDIEEESITKTGRLISDKIQIEIDSLKETVLSLEELRNNLYRRQSSLEADTHLNIASAEIELQQLLEERERKEITADAIELAYIELNSAINEYRYNYRELLEGKTSEYIQQISGVNGRKVIIDEDFNISISESGRTIPVSSISKGARDQLYLAIRFALSDFLSDERRLPMIFDDPFTTSDSERLNNIKKLLKTYEDQRQFILLSHDSKFNYWGEKIVVK